MTTILIAAITIIDTGYGDEDTIIAAGSDKEALLDAAKARVEELIDGGEWNREKDTWYYSVEGETKASAWVEEKPLLG